MKINGHCMSVSVVELVDVTVDEKDYRIRLDNNKISAIYLKSIIDGRRGKKPVFTYKGMDLEKVIGCNARDLSEDIVIFLKNKHEKKLGGN
ncbi:hypothetical protein [uncultured Clostridium sp.]|uniref:hypothetical protein n=1 Tax=uncultured Clostridium sp. TaxID=59620 RepID=UPI0025EAA11D|nr:hypothetical protein [uncultured Clostridium sp.]